MSHITSVHSCYWHGARDYRACATPARKHVTLWSDAVLFSGSRSTLSQHNTAAGTEASQITDPCAGCPEFETTWHHLLREKLKNIDIDSIGAMRDQTSSWAGGENIRSEPVPRRAELEIRQSPRPTCTARRSCWVAPACSSSISRFSAINRLSSHKK